MVATIPCRARHGIPVVSDVVEIGEQARLALARSAGVALPLATFAGAPYLDAAGEIVWVGARLPALHPRAVVTGVVPPRGIALKFDPLPSRGWSKSLPHFDPSMAGSIADAARRLRRALITTAIPRGFGNLLAGREPEFPLGLAACQVRDLAAAYARADEDAVIEASIALLGVGTGLTPSGDDLVGGALFGRRFITAHGPAWVTAANVLSREIGRRSHVISAALFNDLANGQSFALLHTLAQTLADGSNEGALRAAQAMTAIGHSSGWDMITGFLIGTTGSLS